MCRVVGAEDSGRPSFTNLAAEDITSECLTYQVLFRHAANLTSALGSQQA